MQHPVTIETSHNNYNNKCLSVEGSGELESDLSLWSTDRIEAPRGKYHAVFLKPSGILTASEILALEHLQASHEVVDDFSALMQIINTSTCADVPDMIGIHLTSLMAMDNVDVLETVASIRTMCRFKCSTKPVAFGVMVDKATDIKVLKELITMDIQGFVTSDLIGDLAEIEHCLTELFQGRTYRSPGFIKRLRAKTKEARREDPNQVRLTARQDQIARLICTRGASNKVIARLLDISESTVKLHVSAIFKKYGVKNRTQLALFSRDMHKV